MIRTSILSQTLLNGTQEDEETLTPIRVVAWALAFREHKFLFWSQAKEGGRWPIPIAMGSFSLRGTLAIIGGVPNSSQWVRNIPTRIPVHKRFGNISLLGHHIPNGFSQSSQLSPADF